MLAGDFNARVWSYQNVKVVDNLMVSESSSDAKGSIMSKYITLYMTWLFTQTWIFSIW